MMNADMQDRMRALLPEPGYNTRLAAFFFAVAIGLLLGALGGERMFRGGDIEQALLRAEIMAARCQALPHADIRILIERRFGNAYPLLDLGQRMQALDFLFAYLDENGCLLIRPDAG